ncbi:MAG: class I SAM-dependent methyltransferase [Bacteroidales bacterium]|nr:class I SAM-dependent methyltransferase [Bacteroidales bacterium]
MKNWDNFDHRNKWSDADVEAHWDEVSPIYISENNKVKGAHDQRFRETIQHLNPGVTDDILSISSRDCEANDYVLKAAPGAKVVNAEISAGLMSEAARVRPYVDQVKISTYSNLPFEDAKFDRIISLETLEHVHDPVQFLKELYRVSTPDCRMVLSCPPLTSEIPYQIFTFLFGGHGEGPHRFPRSSEVKALLKKTGWELKLHKGTVLIPVGPRKLQDFGEKILDKFQGTYIAELGIRQFYVCEKYR